MQSTGTASHPRDRALKAMGWITGLALIIGLCSPVSVSADEVPPDADLPASDLQEGYAAAVPEEERTDKLGSDWEASTDVVVTGFGSAEGFHIATAAEKDGYSFHIVATLGRPSDNVDRWIGNLCVTADGLYAVATYAPRAITNDEFTFRNGASAAIVDLATGDVTHLGQGFSIAYFNPGCGASTEVALSRFEGTTTSVAVFDAASKELVSQVDVADHLTSIVPTTNGGFVAASDDGLSRFDSSGTRTLVADTAGTPYSLVVDSNDEVTYVQRSGETAQVRRVSLDESQDSVLLATGDVTEVNAVRSTSGTAYVVGAAVDASSKLSVQVFEDASPDVVISSSGALAISSPFVPSSTGEAPVPFGTATGITSEGAEVRLAAPLEGAPVDPEEYGQTSGGVAGRGTTPTDPNRECSVARNDPGLQVLQPKPRQVEWAVDRAVENNLMITRPVNWNHTGNASAYQPQVMFPRPTLLGGGQVPAQILLGIFAQESNLTQASRYTNPGQAGNPLIGLFYGNDRFAGFEDEEFWDVDFPEADCGYGVGQITTGMEAGGSLTYTQQRAIAVDYTVNVAKALQMIGEKWNETRAAGLILNDGDEAQLENWFFALWAYNTGFHAEGAPGARWGVGWTNNPANTDYAIWRGSFLDGDPSDAAYPQLWPYPEKVLGFAANSYDLVERVTTVPGAPEYDYTYVSAFRPAWWAGETDPVAEQNRTNVKPPIDLFCEMSVNECDWADPDSCTRADWECWWNEPAEWKNCTSTGSPNTECGFEFVRFDPASSYMTEQVNGDSMPPNCSTTGLPSGSLVIDDSSLEVGSTVTSYSPALASYATTPSTRPACSPLTSHGSFDLDFGDADANGNYPSKIDFHQVSAGLNDHIYFSHTWPGDNTPASEITGTWTLDQSVTGWARLLVHLPDQGGWAQGASYQVATVDGVVSRTLMQHRYANQWVSLGVFEFAGVPSVSLSNVEPQLVGTAGADGASYIAWDAVAVQPLAAEPTDFVVALGDSFSAGEGVGTTSGSSYYLETDNDGNDVTANACHRSTGAWSRKATLDTSLSPIGARADSLDPTLDFHFLACSGAEGINILPAGMLDGRDLPAEGQALMPTQLDQGYLDDHTTLVTMSIGGNDIGFASVVTACAGFGGCGYKEAETLSKISDELPITLRTVLDEVHDRAPNATIYIAGYPKLFETGSECITVNAAQRPWLNGVSDSLNSTIGDTVATFVTDTGASAVFGDPTSAFSGHNLCASPGAINGLVTTLTPGESTLFGWPLDLGVSQQSVHPNYFGTDLYAAVMEDTLDGVYP